MNGEPIPIAFAQASPAARDEQIAQRLASERMARIRGRLWMALHGDVDGLFRPDPTSERYRMIANAVRDVIPEQEIQARLRELGFTPEQSRWKLAAISPLGGGVAVEHGRHGALKATAKGQAGAVFNQRILRAFPELVFLTARNMPTFDAGAGVGAQALNASNVSPGAPQTHAWDLSAVASNWDVTAATAEYNVSASNPPGDPITSIIVTDPAGSANVGSLDNAGTSALIAWPPSFVETNFGTNPAALAPGTWSESHGAPGGTPWNLNVGNEVFILHITYQICS